MRSSRPALRAAVLAIVVVASLSAAAARALPVAFTGMLVLEGFPVAASIAGAGVLDYQRSGDGMLAHVSISPGAFAFPSTAGVPGFALGLTGPGAALVQNAALVGGNAAIVLDATGAPCTPGRPGIVCGAPGVLRGRGGLDATLQLLIGTAYRPLLSVFSIGLGAVGRGGVDIASDAAIAATARVYGAPWTTGAITAVATRAGLTVGTFPAHGGQLIAPGGTATLNLVTPVAIRSSLSPETTFAGVGRLTLHFQVEPVPEPGVAAMLGLGLALLARGTLMQRRRGARPRAPTRAALLLSLVAIASTAERAQAQPSASFLDAFDLLWTSQTAGGSEAIAYAPPAGTVRLGTNGSTAFPRLAGPPLVDSNGHVLLMRENDAVFGDVVLVERLEPGSDPAAAAGRSRIVARLGGASGNPGVWRPSDADMVYGRLLLIADAGADREPNTVDGKLVLVDPATGAARGVEDGNPAHQLLAEPRAVAVIGTTAYVADRYRPVLDVRGRLVAVNLVSGFQRIVAEGEWLDRVDLAIGLAPLADGTLVWLGEGDPDTVRGNECRAIRIDPADGRQSHLGLLPNCTAGNNGVRFRDIAPSPVPGTGVDSALIVEGADGGITSTTQRIRLLSVQPRADDQEAVINDYLGAGLALTELVDHLSVAPQAECNNGVHDHPGDGSDGYADLSHPGCSGPFDVSEAFDCADGIDQDADGLLDTSDPGCRMAQDPSEERDCADRIDDDGDGSFDFDGFPGETDRSCADASGASESPACDNGLDDDGDGRVDWPADPHCLGYPGTSEVAAECNDGIDNDGDGTIDLQGGRLQIACDATHRCPWTLSCVGGLCDPAPRVPRDLDCVAASPRGESPGDCANGLDDDGDGTIDTGGGLLVGPRCPYGIGCFPGQACVEGVCAPNLVVAADPDCADPDQPLETHVFPCNDGIDDDGDGLVDLADPGCGGNPRSIEDPQCSNGVDDDGDGLVDLADIGCFSASSPTERPACNDDRDNDESGSEGATIDWDPRGFSCQQDAECGALFARCEPCDAPASPGCMSQCVLADQAGPDPDPDCKAPWSASEGSGDPTLSKFPCGLGAELAPVLALVAAFRRRCAARGTSSPALRS